MAVPSGTTRPRRTVRTTAPTRLGLTVMQPNVAPIFIPLDQPIVLGRDRTCDQPLVDCVAASRVHLRLTSQRGVVRVEDMNSSNGTFVAGRRVTVCAAQPGSVLRVGDTFVWVLTMIEPWEPPNAKALLIGGTSLAPIRRLIGLVGPTSLRVLVLGESGTGKELVARALHAASRRTGPFVPVNCSALPAALVESELFGHARGAFTGADRARHGLFVAAQGGTLFLDEVGELDPLAQAKLLRVIEDGEVRPIGSDRALRIDARIIAATNRDIGQAVEQEKFRGDLRARLGEVEMTIPPLRSRTEDLPALCRHLLHRSGGADTVIKPDALEALAIHDWPLNVRELDNVLRTATLESSALITLENLPERIHSRWFSRRAEVSTRITPPDRDGDELRKRVEHELGQSNGNIRHAALAVGVARGHLYRLLRRWNLRPQDFRRGTKVAPSTDKAKQ